MLRVLAHLKITTGIHMRSTLARAALLLALSFICVARGTEQSAAPGDTTAPATGPAAVLALLAKRFPDIHFRDIHPSATIPGWFEVDAGTELVYSDATGDHLFVGYIVDSHNRENLTAKRWSELTTIDYKTLPLSRAIKTVRGDGSRQLVVFEDPLCPFCRKLEKSMADLTNVTIYTFLFPLESLHPGATVFARQIWCSSDRSAAWSAWMQRADGDTSTPKSVDGTVCNDDPIAQNRTLGQQLRINATPTLVFTDGSRISNAISKDEIEKHLGAVTPPAVAAAGAAPSRN
jgi:thiol:disulfide interchange protein DsbC